MFLKSVVDLKEIPANDRPHVALVGRSNVGKSTMVNALSGVPKLANVSSSPGRTRTLNFYELEKWYYLVDLPGYGFARGLKNKKTEFSKLITDYLQEVEQLRFVLVVIDARLGPTPLDEKMIAFLQAAKLPFALIANKTDKLTHSELLALKRRMDGKYPGVTLHYHSIKDSAGRGELRRIIELAAHEK